MQTSNIIISNMSQWKKTMKVGQKWKFYFLYEVGVPSEVVEREVVIVQSNSFAMSGLRVDPQTGKREPSWLDWPKASDVTFIQEEGQNTKIKVKNNIMGGYLIYQPV